MRSGDRRKRNTAARRRARLSSAALAFCLAAAVAGAGPAQAAAGGAPAPAASAAPRSADPRGSALAEARATGRAVPVDALTTADSTTQALPDGAFSTTTTLAPTRMKNAAGAWEAIDPTLVRRSDGSIATAATPNGLRLSGGGTGPVITATDPAGHSLALLLPLALPAPVLSGATAIYRDVYPGVDLSVTAAPTGGFSEVFEIEDAAAATAARGLRFTTRLSGLSLHQDADGALSVTDPSTGRTVMSAPRAVMWDSATAGAPAHGVSAEFEDTTGARSSAAGPGRGAHTGTLPITDTAGALTFAGTPGDLDTGSPTYPLYFDPTWTEPYQSGGTQDYTEVQSGCPSYTNLNNVSQPGVGDVTTITSCPGAYESYFQIDTANVLDSSYDIKSATLKINEVYSSLNSCGEGSENIAIYTTSPIGSGTDWSNRPGTGLEITSESLESVGNSVGTLCSGGVVAGNFNVLSGIQQARSSNWPNWTFVMIGNETNGSNSLERFNNNPSITTVYDIKPNPPAELYTWPTPVTGISSTGQLGTDACPSSSAPGYLGIGNVGGSDISTLSAHLTSPVAAAQMNATFTLHDVTTGATTGTYTSSGWSATGAEVSVQTGSLANGNEYSWSGTAYDQFDTSGVSATCSFKVDTTAPDNPAITDPSWPTLASGQTGTVETGGTGTFTVSSADAVSGIAGFYSSIDAHPVPSAGGTYQSGTGATVSYTPLAWGAHTLYVQAMDNAGNLSGITSYSFYVPWNPATVGVPGAIDGGHVPDLVTNPATGTDSGDLVMVPGDSSPDATPTVISPQLDSPDGTSWANFQVTHDGSLTNHPGFDDLWAFQNTTHTLYLYLNDQSGTPYETTANHNAIAKGEIDDDAFNNAYATASNAANACVDTSTATDACASYDDSDWSSLTQVLAPGDLYAGDPNTDAKTGAVDDGTPGLLTVEGGTLWYYQGQGDANYLNIAEQLGTTGWDGTTLIGTMTTGTGTSTKTYLWARIDATGAIMQYPITFDSSGNLVDLGTPTGSAGTAVTIPSSATDLLPSAAYPQLYAWDLHGTGHADLIATTPSGTVIDWPGSAPTAAGLAQFALPESLAAATSSSGGGFTLASVGTVFPGGTTWDDGTATLGFDEGQLTVTLDGTGQVVTQYGTASPGAYLVLQADGNLVIYSSAGAALWALNGPEVHVAAGDSIHLTGSTLTLLSATGATLWTAESSVPIADAAPGVGAFTTADGTLAVTVGAGTVFTGIPVQTGTSPSIADTGDGTYAVAFQATNGDLEIYSQVGTVTDTGHAMAAATSPAIAAYAGGGWAAAFQAASTDMDTYTSDGILSDSGAGMEAGTSPAIAASPDGGYKATMEVNTTALYTDAFTSLTATSGTLTNPQLGMMKGTDPAIAALSTGGYEIAFQANTGGLWLWGDGSDGGDKSLGMAAGTSPAITALADGQWQTAFQANTGILWTYGNATGSDTGLAMAAGTSPSIFGTGGQNYALGWHGSGGDLETLVYGGNPTDTGEAMGAGATPSFTP